MKIYIQNSEVFHCTIIVKYFLNEDLTIHRKPCIMYLLVFIVPAKFVIYYSIKSIIEFTILEKDSILGF